MKQPRALIPLFFTEMWERFGYYTIQGLLVLYLIMQLNFTDADAFITMSEFLSWVYISPIFGGLIADQILGYRYTILIGALLLCLGYMILAFSDQLFLHLSLAIIIVGNGFLKPNSASFLGKFYYYDDPRRYPGFTFYFIGINVGGLFSMLISSFSVEYVGYHTAFAVASSGMLLAVVVFIYGFRFFENRGMPINRQQIKSPGIRAFANPFILTLCIIIAIMLLHFMLHSAHISELLLIVVAVCVLISLFYIQTTYNQTTRNKLIAIIILTCASIVFWAIQLQIFFSVMLFIDRHVNKTLLNFAIPTTLFIILEPIFILLIGPWVAKLWEKLSLRHKEPSPAIKFALGLIFTGLAMAVLTLSVYLTPANTAVSAIWLVVFFLLLTLGELLVSPTGLAMITELAPIKLTGFIMGVWYMVIGIGGLIAGMLAKLVLQPQTDNLFIHHVKVYGHAFCIYALLAVLVGIFLLLFSPQLKKLIQSQHQYDV